MRARNAQGVDPREIAIFVRSVEQLERARAAALESGLPFNVLDEHMETNPGSVSISTMHLAKGLEFRAVAVMACDYEVVSLQERIESVADDADLEEVYNTELHLLYVARTRARDHLLVTGIEPARSFWMTSKVELAVLWKRGGCNGLHIQRRLKGYFAYCCLHNVLLLKKM